MTTMTNERPDMTWATTSPYIADDLIEIERDGMFVQAHVRYCEPILGIIHFGQRWMLTTSHGQATCDDDGRNYTRGARVRPSEVNE